ncbi:unnamed protein product [Boreogadus saida]
MSRPAVQRLGRLLVGAGPQASRSLLLLVVVVQTYSGCLASQESSRLWDICPDGREETLLTFLGNFPALKTRMASCGSCFWSIMWLVILLIIGWPISITLGGLYGLFSPLTTCVGLDRLSDLLLEGANVGRRCAQNMRHGKPLC